MFQVSNWLVNLEQEEIRVYWEPIGKTYKNRTIFRIGDTITVSFQSLNPDKRHQLDQLSCKNASIFSAASLPSAMAQTTSDCPLRASPAAKTLGILL